jgi:hypothetical protein
MAQDDKLSLHTPIGNLEWVIISGEGKEDMYGKSTYTASVVLDLSKEAHKEFIQQIKEFWEENKPKGFKKPPKFVPLYDYYEYTDEKDEDGDRIKNLIEGKKLFTAKTGTQYPDGKPKVVQVSNSFGAKVVLNCNIGNGSRGRLGITLAVCETRVKKNGPIVDAGVSAYLNGIQITKLIEYEGGGISFDAVEDEEGDNYAGEGMGGVVDEENDTSTDVQQGKKPPRL